jgi:hypothetical protein
MILRARNKVILQSKIQGTLADQVDPEAQFPAAQCNDGNMQMENYLQTVIDCLNRNKDLKNASYRKDVRSR